MWSNYPNALTYIAFFTYLRNTILIAGGSVVGTLFSCPPAAYAFARMRWWGRDVYFIVMLATIMLPIISIIFPLYLMFKSWGWIGTLLPLIVPAFGGTPLYIFLLRQFFLTIPRELSEAATIDGASEFGTFWRIILPLAKPPLITISIFTLMSNWNDFLGPLIFLPQEPLWTVSLGLQQFFSIHLTAWAYLLATSFVFTLPVLLVFVIAQRLFVQGITLTGVKG
jgi:multiple sugar transport system permease protein